MRRRENSFDLLRLLLAILVMLSHSAEYLDGNRAREPLTLIFHTLSFGELAVDAFFILSGFLIIQSWDRVPEVGPFLFRRAARIYPAFIVASLFCVFVIGGLGVPRPAAYYLQIDYVQMLARLIFLMPPGQPVFPGLASHWIDGATWTIHYEFLCYLMVATLGVVGPLRPRHSVLLLWGLAMTAFLIRRAIGGAGADAAVFYDTPSSLLRFAMLFLSGAVFARYDLHRRTSPAIVALEIAICLTGLRSTAFAEPAMATAGAYLLLAAGSSFVPWRRLPDISYGVYLYGAPIEMLILYRLPPLHPLAVFALALPLAVGLGAASWRFVEAPCLRRVAKRTTRRADRHGHELESSDHRRIGLYTPMPIIDAAGA